MLHTCALYVSIKNQIDRQLTTVTKFQLFLPCYRTQPADSEPFILFFFFCLLISAGIFVHIQKEEKKLYVVEKPVKAANKRKNTSGFVTVPVAN